MANNYNLYGRAMSGNEVTGYYLRDAKTGETKRVNREQMAFLVGAKRVLNCTGQIYDESVIFRGQGFEIKSLPVITGDGQLNAGLGGAAIQGRRGATAEETMAQYGIVAAVVAGKSTIGYILQDRGGARAYVSREVTMGAAREKKIFNATTQMSNGQPILRGNGINLNTLPTMTYDEAVTSGLVRR